jgi:hypothetical protein
VSVIPTAPWYNDALNAVREQQAGVLDYLGRPWAEHFERVALRLIFRNPAATHDQFDPRGWRREPTRRKSVSSPAS